MIRLLQRMWSVNPTWGSPRIRNELAKLGLQASTAAIRQYRPKSRGQRSQSWRTFLQNHSNNVAAMDFFVVPTVTFRLLYVLVVLKHEQRKIVHFNITEALTAAWTAQQIIKTFPYKTAPKYLLRDRTQFTDRSSCSGSRGWASSRSCFLQDLLGKTPMWRD